MFMDTITAIIIGVVALAFLVVVLVVWKATRRKFSAQDQLFFRQKWDLISIKVNKDPARAILEADKLLDLVLKKKGYQGSLGEKLKKSAKLFSNINGIWKAHKLRNAVAHEIDHQLSPNQAHEALQKFQRGLRDLGVDL